MRVGPTNTGLLAVRSQRSPSPIPTDLALGRHLRVLCGSAGVANAAMFSLILEVARQTRCRECFRSLRDGTLRSVLDGSRRGRDCLLGPPQMRLGVMRGGLPANVYIACRQGDERVRRGFGNVGEASHAFVRDAQGTLGVRAGAAVCRTDVRVCRLGSRPASRQRLAERSLDESSRPVARYSLSPTASLATSSMRT